MLGIFPLSIDTVLRVNASVYVGGGVRGGGAQNHKSQHGVPFRSLHLA